MGLLFLSAYICQFLTKNICHFQISNSNREDKDETSLTIQNATVDNGPSTSKGGSRQSAPVENISLRDEYKCYVCKVNFTLRSDFQLHKKSAHKEDVSRCVMSALYISLWSGL